ncbi:hypothetical protein JOE31_001924 [Arthrobacter sp. PvP023]|nr:hypothetical protein [Arthrobacter sp. PvP023]
MYGNKVLTLDDPALPGDMQKAAADGTLKPEDQTSMKTSWARAAEAAAGKPPAGEG